MELRIFPVSSPLLFFPGPASDILELVSTGSVYGQSDRPEPFYSVCGPLRESKHAQGGTLIGCVNDRQAHESDNTRNCGVLLLEAGENSRKNLNEVVHGFIFSGLFTGFTGFTGLFAPLCSALCPQNTPDALR